MNQVTLALSLAGLSFMMTVIWGGPLLRVLRHFRIGKQIRVEEPGHHAVKMGTPTMGGVMFILPVLLLTGLLNAVALIGFTANALGRSILAPMIVMVGFALLGAVDDWEGIRGKRRGQGMTARAKFAGQVVLALGAAWVLKYMLDVPSIFVPGVELNLTIGWWYVPVAAFIIVAESNAVNFTDGLDGLAGLISATAFAAYGGIALMQDQVYIARFCFTLVGAVFGFLWFNVHSRRVVHGRYRIAGPRSNAGRSGPHDRAMAAAAPYSHHPAQRGRERDLADRLFQADQGQALVQDGASALALRAARLERDPGRAEILADRPSGGHDRHRTGIGIRMRDWTGKRVLILGAARQGVALARWLGKHGSLVTLSDALSEQQMAPARINPGTYQVLKSALGSHVYRLVALWTRPS